MPEEDNVIKLRTSSDAFEEDWWWTETSKSTGPHSIFGSYFKPFFRVCVKMAISGCFPVTLPTVLFIDENGAQTRS